MPMHVRPQSSSHRHLQSWEKGALDTGTVTRHTPELLLCTGAGIRQFHFNAWKDPNGTLAAHPAGLKLADTSNVTLDPKYSYFGAWASF